MKQALDEAFTAVREELPTLLAVVLSVAPDGLIVWSWSYDLEPNRALGLAALHRAGSLCLDGLTQVDQQLRRLVLTSNSSWIASRPLQEYDDMPSRISHPHYVMTTAFCGQLPAGTAVMQGARLRARVLKIVEQHSTDEYTKLRDAFATMVLNEDDPLSRLESILDTAGLRPAQVERLDQLQPQERQRLISALQC